MKSKEEIEQLAENSSEVQEVTYTTQHKITYNYYKRGYFEGYTQSQEDIRELLLEIKNNWKGNKLIGGTYEKICNSLNKQD